MGALDGRVAVTTAAGRGLGRNHALLFAPEGAEVVVNDRGGANDGAGADASLAELVAKEIRDRGGEAVSNFGDIADGEGAQGLVNTAIECFSDLDILVNNGGITRDGVLVNVTEAEC
ncbi:MAG: SDR family NAD(P)-dependent oxidoreductase, partial [Actinomycetota bacterium]